MHSYYFWFIKQCLYVPGNSTSHSKAFIDSQFIDDRTQNWPDDDDISEIVEMTQEQILKRKF